MKQKSTVLLIILTVAALAGAVSFSFLRRTTSSASAPEIRFASDVIQVSTAATREELLQGVTAADPEDGDVTDSLVVEGITRMGENATATVTYAAFDSQNHVTKAERSVQFTDYAPPRFALSAPLLFSVTDRIDILSCVRAQDIFDGDLTHKVKYTFTDGSGAMDSVGTYPLELRVTNRMGDTAVLPITVEIAAANVNTARITLSDYLIYLTRGASFDPGSYVTEYRAGSDVVSGPEGLLIDSNVDVNTPGVYSVTYSYDGAALSRTRLIVVVE